MNWHALHEGEGDKLKELAVQYNLHPSTSRTANTAAKTPNSKRTPTTSS